jgi:hypothetical protein
VVRVKVSAGHLGDEHGIQAGFGVGVRVMLEHLDVGGQLVPGNRVGRNIMRVCARTHGVTSLVWWWARVVCASRAVLCCALSISQTRIQNKSNMGSMLALFLRATRRNSAQTR